MYLSSPKATQRNNRDSNPYEATVGTRIPTPEYDVEATADTVTVSNIDIGQIAPTLSAISEIRFDVTVSLGNQVASTATAGLDESATLEGLEPGTTYTVSVVAVALVDGEVFTDSAPGTTQVTTEAAQLPQLATPVVTAILETPREFIVTWNAVANAGSYELATYVGSAVAPGNIYTGPRDSVWQRPPILLCLLTPGHTIHNRCCSDCRQPSHA